MEMSRKIDFYRLLASPRYIPRKITQSSFRAADDDERRGPRYLRANNAARDSFVRESAAATSWSEVALQPAENKNEAMPLRLSRLVVEWNILKR